MITSTANIIDINGRHRRSSVFIAESAALRCVFHYIGDAKTLTICERVCRRWKLILDCGNYAATKSRVNKMTFCISDNVETVTCLYEKGADDKILTLKFLIPTSTSVESEILLALLLTRLSKKFHISKGIGFIDCRISKAVLCLVLKFGHKLCQIRFLRCFIEEKALSALRPLHSIKELALDQCVGCKNSISNDAIIPILRGNSLKILELSGAHSLDKLDDLLIQQLLRMLRLGSFECLKLANCPRISTDAIGCLANYFMDKKQGRFVIFLDKMSFFDSNAFLDSQKRFSKDCSVQSTKRLRFNSGNCTIWLEIESEEQSSSL